MVKVGCGKSSLLSALLGDMKRTRGVANLYGRVAYVAQQAWIQNNTLADNITFGKRFNNELYQKVRERRTLIKKKIKFSSCIRKFTMEQLQSHI